MNKCNARFSKNFSGASFARIVNDPASLSREFHSFIFCRYRQACNLSSIPVQRVSYWGPRATRYVKLGSVFGLFWNVFHPQSAHCLEIRSPSWETKAAPSRPMKDDELLLLQKQENTEAYLNKLVDLLFCAGGHQKWPVEIQEFLESFEGLQDLLDMLLQKSEYQNQDQYRYIFVIGKENFDVLYRIAKDRGLQFRWRGEERSVFFNVLTDGEDGEGDSERLRQSQISRVYNMLRMNPSLANALNDQGESALCLATERGFTRHAKMILQTLENEKIPLSPQEVWMERAVLDDTDFLNEDFLALPSHKKEDIYRFANIHGSLKMVLRLNRLGMKDSKPVYEPKFMRMFSSSMDARQKQQVLEKFLTDLRKEGRLMTSEEFEDFQKQHFLSGQTFLRKGAIGRVVGRDRIEKAIRDLGLSQVKVPQKVAVIGKRAHESGELQIQEYDSRIQTDDLTVYAQKIERSTFRSLTLREVKELIQLCEEVNFCDVWDHNFVVADDGVYFIDTEYTSFGHLYYGKLHRLERITTREDTTSVSELIEQRAAVADERGKTQPHKTNAEYQREKKAEDVSARYFGQDMRKTPFRFSLEELLSVQSLDSVDEMLKQSVFTSFTHR